MSSIRNNLLAFALVATLIPSLGLGLVTFWRYQQVVGEQVAIEQRLALGRRAGAEEEADAAHVVIPEEGRQSVRVRAR